METPLFWIASHPAAVFFALCLAFAMTIDMLARHPRRRLHRSARNTP